MNVFNTPYKIIEIRNKEFVVLSERNGKIVIQNDDADIKEISIDDVKYLSDMKKYNI